MSIYKSKCQIFIEFLIDVKSNPVKALHTKGHFMKNTDYLDRLLLRYAGTFNIYMPYKIHGKEYPAYGCFFSSVAMYLFVTGCTKPIVMAWRHCP